MTTGRSGSGLCPTRDTRPSWVPNFQTRRQPLRKSDQIVQFLSKSGQVSIGVDYLENDENSAKKIWKTVESGKKILKNGRNRPDLAKSNEILAIFGKILARSSEENSKLVGSTQKNLKTRWENDGLVGSGFSDLRGGDPISDPLILGFGEWNPLLTAGVVSSVGGGSSSIGGRG